ncbi:hypothetical protein KWAN_143 [Erwinia phage vB_EamM_Kwan]|uniref:Uncharacterized protein n=1 Tax=Erwinia phage vB_EamM_Kwan TaxID=1883374 RepID=A0A1B2IE61_9CAUD|nr:hypothetical protein BIZ80_gp156 [Erwinia phage vB_EamM_Kwan]ANZ49495.1 hypothetical protein KWAN_143 [Erwinia phage vB_EamM_Kwan]
MANARGLLRGPKFSGRHQTIIEEAKTLLVFAKDCDVIKKVVLGKIKPTGGKASGLKFKLMETSVAVEVISPRQWQVLYFIGNPPEVLEVLQHNYPQGLIS